MDQQEIRESIQNLRKRGGMTNERLSFETELMKELGDHDVDQLRLTIERAISEIENGRDREALVRQLTPRAGTDATSRLRDYAKELGLSYVTLQKASDRGLNQLVDKLMVVAALNSGQAFDAVASYGEFDFFEEGSVDERKLRRYLKGQDQSIQTLSAAVVALSGTVHMLTMQRFHDRKESLKRDVSLDRYNELIAKYEHEPSSTAEETRRALEQASLAFSVVKEEMRRMIQKQEE